MRMSTAWSPSRSARWAKLALAATALCLAPAGLVAQDAKPSEPAQKLEQVKETFEKSRDEIYKKLRAAESDEEQTKLFEELRALIKQAVADARAVAESAAGTETAAEAWAFVLQNGGQSGNLEVVGKAFDALVGTHIASPVWKDLAGMLPYMADQGVGAERFERGARTLMEKSPFKGVQAAAMFALGKVLLDAPEQAKQDEGLALLRRVLKDFAGVKEAADAYAEAEGTLFWRENLQVGMQVPDFEASDENGVKFKLSEYKGKVVLIDFWGFW